MTDIDSTIIVDHYRGAATASAGWNSYRGLEIHALPGLHDFLADLVARHIQRGASVLDLAAGTGAMSLRLNDLGYSVQATDYVEESFKPEGIPFKRADLNGDFSTLFSGKTFQAVMASEIPEHLENPRHFFRQCNKILDVGGHVILSTPNPHNNGSVASFVRTGHFLWFSDADYSAFGHISPITRWQLAHCIDEAGFAEVWSGSFGRGASQISGLTAKLLARAIALLSGVPRKWRGEIYVCVVRKLPDLPRGEA